MTTPSTDLARETVDRYVDFWNGRMSGEGAVTDQVRYVAPVGVLTGPEALREFRTRFLGHVGASAEFRATGEPDLHHDRARLRWEILVDGNRFAAGTDVLTIEPDGRVGAVTAFLDQPPAGFDPHAHD